jgi:hypothetical protein
MDSSSNRRGANAIAPAGDFSLLQLVQELGADGVPLCREFAEMMLVDIAADASPFASTAAAVELMSEPPTKAEDTAVRVLAEIAIHARDAQQDDDALLVLMSQTARYVARFESYLAERGARRTS